MEILGIKALSLVRIRFQIGSVGAANSDGVVCLKEKFKNGKLNVYVDRKVAKNLYANDVVEILGTLAPDMENVFTVLVLARERNTVVSNIIFSVGDEWISIYMSLARQIDRASAAG